jgi:hypothetical protein
MSSALAMVLAAGMTVGSGPEKVSGEIEQRLDLRGEWEGTYQVIGGPTWHARLGGGFLAVQTEVARSRLAIRFVDERNGKLRMGWGGRPPLTLGTYKQEGDRVVLSFWLGVKANRGLVLDLKRVKLGK